MKRKLILITALLIQFSILNAETIITASHQGFRKDDILFKQQIEYKDPGLRGSNVVWDFSRLKFVNENYKVRYSQPAVSKPDSQCITNIEHRTMYKHLLIRDSLFLTGFENSGSKLNYEKPQLALRFPFALRDSISKSYSGSGIYMDMLYVETSGTSYTIADATGTLILPEEDTLRNVLRIRSQQEYIQKTCPIDYSPKKKYLFEDSISVFSMDSLRKASTDTIYFRMETCKWYAPGYRYPLFETISNHSRSAHDTTEMEDISTALYFPQSLHNYLKNDPENMAMLDSISAAEKVNEPLSGDTLKFDYNCYPNPIRNNLQVELLLDFPSTVTFRVFDIAGNLEFTQQEGNYPVGLHYFTLGLSGLRYGGHILHFVVNEQSAQTVLLKL